MQSAVVRTATDAELLNGVAGGDESAFVWFVERHHDSLQRWLVHTVGQKPEVEDILQETFLVVLNGAAEFRGSGSARAWLFGIARHRVARQFRRRVDEPASFEPLDELGLRAGWGDPEAAAARAEEVEQLRRALQSLPEDAREILVLRDVEGFTTPETAQILELTVPATKSRLHRARLALMAELRAKQEEPHG